MIADPHRYAAEKFNAARRNLMLPHPGGEVRSIVSAFSECMHGLRDVKPEHLDELSADWVRTLSTA